MRMAESSEDINLRAALVKQYFLEDDKAWLFSNDNETNLNIMPENSYMI